ncbi:uncharacterized protein [Nicotiana tomentosiformis]|uniref:uncharacterized protein n=1 Tax=Nicotiana tomentosiformis TaxID=4098 RepID=UPI00388C800D
MTIASSSRTVVPPAEKPGNFSGANFKGWQQRVFFWLTTLGIEKFTSEDPSVHAVDMSDNEKFMIVEAWKQADFLCKGYILNALEDDLYNVYSAVKISKELWDALEKKYKTEDACLKKFVVFKFLDYKMIDSKIVGTQIEEDNKKAEKMSRRNSMIMGANIIEEIAPKSKKRKRSSDRLRSRTKRNSRATATIVKKAGHKAPDCRLPKKDKKKGQANIVEKNDDIDDLCAMLSECNLVKNPKERWIEPLDIFVLSKKHLRLTLLLAPKKSFPWEILQQPKLKVMGSYS